MARKRRRIDKKTQRIIARQRIIKLFQMAEKRAQQKQLHLANRYVELARKLSMRYLTPIPQGYKRRFCKYCYQYHLPGVTCRVRVQGGKLVIYCYHCKKFTRIPFKN